jgi:pimeloyl-ACP methyl ester carboxylesterase
VAALEPHATVVAYDPRGAGASDRPERGYDFPLHAARGHRPDIRTPELVDPLLREFLLDA